MKRAENITSNCYCASVIYVLEKENEWKKRKFLERMNSALESTENSWKFKIMLLKKNRKKYWNEKWFSWNRGFSIFFYFFPFLLIEKKSYQHQHTNEKKEINWNENRKGKKLCRNRNSIKLHVYVWKCRSNRKIRSLKSIFIFCYRFPFDRE